MTALSTNCPHCGSINSFFMHKVRKGTAVNCSSCGKSIGPWGELVRTAAGRAGAAPTFVSSWPPAEVRPSQDGMR